MIMKLGTKDLQYIVGFVTSLVPRPPCPAFVACSMKSWGTKAGRGGLGMRLICNAVVKCSLIIEYSLTYTHKLVS